MGVPITWRRGLLTKVSGQPSRIMESYYCVAQRFYSYGLLWSRTQRMPSVAVAAIFSKADKTLGKHTTNGSFGTLNSHAPLAVILVRA